MTSLRRQLLVYLLGGALLAALLAGFLTYRAVLRESDEILDYHLRQVALSLGAQRFGGDLPPLDAGEEARFDLVVRVWDESGVRLYQSHPHSDLPGFAQLGFATVAEADGGWRVFSMQTRGNVVQVAQPLAVRERLAAGMALRVLTPFLVLIPALGLLVWLAIGRGLAPLAEVAGAVARRSPGSLTPLRLARVPDELRPLVAALDGLLVRLGEALEVQKAFTADAAHELRTPLAALQLQVQLLERSRDEAERQQAVLRLKAGLQRATHMVEQLLTLARQEGAAGEFAAVDLHALAAQAVAELAPLAQAKDIDLGMEGEAGRVELSGDAAALRILLANLIGNAVRYTPQGGRVDVRVAHAAGEGVRLEVVDSGPGIPEAERQRVCDRFYRLADTEAGGSGLGLAIARRVCERHAARLSLLDGPGGRGLKVEVAFPERP